MTPISDAELLAAIAALEGAASGDQHDEISTDRADAIDRYLGKTYGDEQPGRSSVVSRDVADVVEGVLANVLRPFVGGDEIVRFEPRSAEDVEQAMQETDYINFVALERNNGFMVLSAAVKDALLLRAGYVKCQWTVRQDVITETYQGLSDEEIGMLVQDADIELVQHSEYPDPSAPQPDPMQMQQMMAQGQQMPPPPMLHDVKVRRSKPTEYAELEPIPPDELLVSMRTRTPSVQQSDFVQHRKHVMLSELRQQGYDVDDDISDDDDSETIEDYARQRFGTRGDLWDDDTNNAARRLVLFKESWLRIDRDGDGIAELRRICQVGSTILADDEADMIPIAVFSALMMPHQHLGVSIYDLIKDLAQQKTALMRSYLDNRYLQNNGRHAVDVNRVNLDDFLVSRPGGMVRVEGDPSSAVFPLVTPDTGQGALQGLEYLDSVRENRTGYTRQSQGMDSDSLINKTALGATLQLNQSQMRLEMIARTLAETGVRDMFRLLHALTLKHSTREEKVRLRNRWVAVNPREWTRRTDLSISVGLGNATQAQTLSNIMIIGQAQEKAMGLGLANPSNVYNLLKKLPSAAGFKNSEEFFTEPKINPQTGQAEMPPPQKPPQVMVAEIQAQADAQKFQATQQADQQKMQATIQADGQKFQAEQAASQAQAERDAALKQSEMQMQLQVQAANDQRQAELDQQKMQLEMIKLEKEYEFKVWLETSKMQNSASLERERMAHEGNTQRTIARASGIDVDSDDKVTAALGPMLQQMQNMIAQLSAPKQVVRDEGGRVVGVQTVQ
jgi:hypothetical protein